MRVLIGCEFSGTMRDAFAALGHDAWSCDLLPSDNGGQHVQGDVLDILNDGWDLAIFHPPCTNLAVSGARWFKDKSVEQERDLEFVRRLMVAPIKRKALENPISIISSRIRKPDQIVHPYFFGCPQFKSTCLWLENLPLLVPTNMLTPPGKGTPERKAWEAIHRAAPSKNRWKERSKTFPGLAFAAAQQWGAR